MMRVVSSKPYRTSISERQPPLELVPIDLGFTAGRFSRSSALPKAIQVADRWHLMENASAAFTDAVRKSMRSIRAAIGATTINPELLTSAERVQNDGYVRLEETSTAILKLADEGIGGWQNADRSCPMPEMRRGPASATPLSVIAAPVFWGSIGCRFGTAEAS